MIANQSQHPAERQVNLSIRPGFAITWLIPVPVAEMRRVLVLPSDRACRWRKAVDLRAIAHLGKAVPKSDHDMPGPPEGAELLTKAAGRL
jgi:hypothetical protein